MRTTLDIDDDLLAAARDLSRAEGRSMGQVISDLVRRGLTTPSGRIGFEDQAHRESGTGGFGEAHQAAYGVDDWPVIMRPRNGAPQGIVTRELIDRIQDELDREDAEAYDFERGAPVVLSTKSG